MNASCELCGAIEPDRPCPAHFNHTVGSCPQYNQSQLRKMNPLEAAWAVMKAKKDAPNYRHASKSEQTAGKICGTCKAWDSSKTDNPMTGYCEWYDFNCMADHTCDAWAGKK